MDLIRYNQPAPGTAPPLLLALVIGLIVAVLYFGRELFVPLAVAVLLSFVLTPLVAFLRKLRVPRVPAVMLVVALAFSIIFSIGAIMGAQLAELAGQLPQYETTLRQKIRDLRPQPGAPAGVFERATDALEKLGEELDREPQRRSPSGSATSEPIPVEIHHPPPRALEYYQRVVTPLLGPTAQTGLILILVIFILLQREELRDRLIRVFGGEDFERTTAAMSDAAGRLSRLFLTLTGMNIVYGAVIAAVLWLIGIPSPILWGILAGLMRFVPYIGSIIAAVFPVLLAAAVDPGWSLVLVTLLVYIVGEFTMGQVMEPWLLGSSTGLTPIAVIAAASFWTWLWGPIGLLLAIPLTVCLIVLGRHVPQLSFIYVLLSDQPALTPAQRFYQRMLAGDIDEITFEAEQLLKKQSLVTYYDEVALPALVMAQEDTRRGRFDHNRLAAMRSFVEELIDDLSDFEVETPEKDADPEAPEPPPDLPVLSTEQLRPSWQVATPVLSIGIRNPLDRAAAAMLADLATKHGIETRVLGAEDVTPSKIDALDLGGAQLAVLSNVDAARAPAYARLLIRRLRRRAPNLEFVLGAWGESTRQSSGGLAGDEQSVPRATTLRQALEIILTAAREEPAATFDRVGVAEEMQSAANPVPIES